MSDFVALKQLRLVDGNDDDPAAMLLRSARKDKAPEGAKDRVAAMLGLVEKPLSDVAKPLPKKESFQRAKRSVKVERFVPFQNLISTSRPVATRKFGAVLVAAVQVAAMIAALFIRPFPHFDEAQLKVEQRQDEPELLFFTTNKASASEKLEMGGDSNALYFHAGMTAPVRIAGTDPTYPESALLYGVSGTVSVQCVVTEKGLAEHCATLKSPAYLDEAVIKASHTWRFTPVMWQGRPVSVHYVFKYSFNLGSPNSV